MKDQQENKEKSNNNKKKDDIQKLDQRVWSQKKNLNAVNLFKEMDKKSNVCDKQYELFFEKDEDLSNNIISNHRIKNNGKKSLYSKYVSKNCERLLNSIYSKINFMKDETKELSKLNTLSFQKISTAYFRTNRPKSAKYNVKNNQKMDRIQTASTYYGSKFNTNSNYSYSKNVKNSMIKKLKDFNKSTSNYNISNVITTCNTDNNYNKLFNNNNFNNNISTRSNFLDKNNSFSTFRNKTLTKRDIVYKKNKRLKIKDIFSDKEEEKLKGLKEIDVNHLYKTNKKKNMNLNRLNNNYRVQINKSFGKYKADNHLKDLNKIQLDDMSVRKDMEDIKFKINEKINDCCTGKFYKKEYEKLKNAYKEKSKDIFNKNIEDFPEKISFHILLTSNNDEKVKINPNGYKIRAMYDFHKKKLLNKNKKLKVNEGNNLGNLMFTKELSIFENVLKKLDNCLDLESVRKYIDEAKYCNDEKILIQKQRTYFPCFSDAKKLLIKSMARKKSTQINIGLKSSFSNTAKDKEEIWNKIKEIKGEIEKYHENEPKETNDEDIIV